MGAAETIKEICSHYNVTIPQLANRLGYGRAQGLYDIANGKVKRISAQLIQKLSSEFSDLNKNWLLTGEGEMLNHQTIHATNSTVVGSNIKGNGNQIMHNDLSEMIKLQQGYQELLQKNQDLLLNKDEQINRLISIIEKSTK